MKKYLLVLVLIVSTTSFSQTINDYQYVVIPAKFSFFKENDKYNLNTLTKLMLEKYGFKTFMSTDINPNELGGNCKILYADLSKENDFFTTKVKIELKDCTEKIVYETEFGKSREKEYKLAYNQALRDAAKSFDKLNYHYNGKNDGVTISNQVENDALVTTLSTIPVSKDSDGVFYFAQPNATGFQVVDNEPKVIMRLFYTSQKNVFMATKGNTNGVVITKNGQWFFEYYQDAKLVSESLNLKF